MTQTHNEAEQMGAAHGFFCVPNAFYDSMRQISFDGALPTEDSA